MKPIELIHVKELCDCTALYDVRIFQQGMKVRDLIRYVCERRNEWGYIDLVHPDFELGPYKGHVEYQDGRITANTLAAEDLDLVIGSISAHGGWRRMDYTVREAGR